MNFWWPHRVTDLRFWPFSVLGDVLTGSGPGGMVLHVHQAGRSGELSSRWL
jgi:hypothetical protein